MGPLRALLACSTGALTGLLVLAPPARAQAPARTDSTAARVDAVFARYDAATTPGCAVAVVRGDEVVLREAYGMAHIGFGVPMTPATSMWVPYSEARVFTALAVAMLARDGRLSLDDDVRRHVPEVPAYASAVTVRQLVHHTSGLADYGVLAGPGWELSDRTSEDEVFRMLARWGRLGFAPGTDKMYSNTDYALLKVLVERVTGGTLHAYLDEQLFGPLGMSRTRVGADQATVVPNHALFYEADGEGYRTLLRYRVSPVGGIAVTTSVDDLVRWARALRDPALGLGALLEGLEAGAPEGEPDEGLAFGVYPVEEGGVRTVTYRGVGEYTYLVRVPEADLSVVTLCNTYAGMWAFGPEVARLYAPPAPPDAPPTAPTGPPEPAPTAAVPPAELERYAGEYRSRDGAPPSFRIGAEDGALQFTAPDGRTFPASPLGGGRFTFDVVPPGVRIDLAFTAADTPDGDVAMQVSEDGEPSGPPRYRWDPWSPTPEALRSYPGTYAGDDVDGTLYVTVEGDRVRMASRGLAATELVPQGQADTFRIPTYAVRFHRDGAGRVTHLTLDATRVAGMRYSREPDRE